MAITISLTFAYPFSGMTSRPSKHGEVMGGAHKAEQISFSQWACCTCAQEGELYGAVRYQE